MSPIFKVVLLSFMRIWAIVKNLQILCPSYLLMSEDKIRNNKL